MNACPSPNQALPLARWIPALDWLRSYDKTWLRGDVVAGITLAAYLLPAGLGDASLANLPPQAGLYACLFGGLVFWLFCSSRHTAITVTSAISLLVGASRPHVALLGRIPGTRRFSDHERHPDNELIPGVMIVRPESGLVYFNMDHVRDTILDRVRAETTPPRLVVLDLSAAPHVDLHSAHMLGSLADELTATGLRVQAVEARSSVRERLRGLGVDAKLAGIDRFTSLADAVENFHS